MKNKGKINLKEEGITLVALVVTIIVLLILAGVTIQMVLGENGIIQKARSAQSTQEIAKAREELQLAINALKIDFYADRSNGINLGNNNEKIETEAVIGKNNLKKKDYKSGRFAGTFRDYVFSTEGMNKIQAQLSTNLIEFDASNHHITYKSILFDVSIDGNVSYISGENTNPNPNNHNNDQSNDYNNHNNDQSNDYNNHNNDQSNDYNNNNNDQSNDYNNNNNDESNDYNNNNNDESNDYGNNNNDESNDYGNNNNDESNG